MKRWVTGANYILHKCKPDGEWFIYGVFDSCEIKEEVARDNLGWLCECNCETKPPAKIRRLLKIYEFYDKIRNYADGHK